MANVKTEVTELVELWEQIINSHVTRVDWEYPSFWRENKISTDDVTALVMSEGEETEDTDGDPVPPISVTLAAWCGGQGTTWDVANVRTFAGYEGVNVDSDALGNESARVHVGELEHDDLKVIAGMVSALEDHPILDESELYEYEHDLLMESWDDHISRDVRDDLNDMLPGIDVEEYDRDDDIRSAYLEYVTENMGIDYWCSDALSIDDRTHNEALRLVANDVLGWDTDDIHKRNARYESLEESARKTFDIVVWPAFIRDYGLPPYLNYHREVAGRIIYRELTDNGKALTVESIRQEIIRQSHDTALGL